MSKDHVTIETTSPINPGHYRQAGRKECIDEIREALGFAGFRGFCRGNAMKYEYRAGQKEGVPAAKDLAKAKWYRQMVSHVIDPANHRDPRVSR